LELKDLLARENIKNIDLLISGLPFKSLPKELFYFTLDEVVNCFFTEESKFIQFSYFKTLKKDFERYFEEINI
jgi:phospholipid N-methyltransferase